MPFRIVCYFHRRRCARWRSQAEAPKASTGTRTAAWAVEHSRKWRSYWVWLSSKSPEEGENRIENKINQYLAYSLEASVTAPVSDDGWNSWLEPSPFQRNFGRPAPAVSTPIFAKHSYSNNFAALLASDAALFKIYKIYAVLHLQILKIRKN